MLKTVDPVGAALPGGRGCSLCAATSDIPREEIEAKNGEVDI